MKKYKQDVGTVYSWIAFRAHIKKSQQNTKDKLSNVSVQLKTLSSALQIWATS